MCDFETQKDADDYLKTHPGISRREFTTLASGAGMAMMMPSIAGAQSISERDVEIRTPDGVADCHFAYPSTGSHAAVLVGRIFWRYGPHSGKWAAGWRRKVTRC